MHRLLKALRIKPASRRAERRSCYRRLRLESFESRLPLTSYLVTTLSDNSQDNSESARDGLVSLREAINAANNNAQFGDALPGSASASDLIEFAPGLLTAGATIRNENGQFFINGSLTIRTGGRPLTFDAMNAGRIFEINSPTAVVSLIDIALTNGSAINGGAILVTNSNLLTLDGVTLLDNTSTGGGAFDGGGAIHNISGNLTLVDAIVQRNDAIGINSGGGAIMSRAGTVTVLESRVELNTAVRAGGAIEVLSGALVVDDCEFRDNAAGGIVTAANPGDGGAVHTGGSPVTVTIIESEFNGNFARRSGGAVWHDEGAMTLSDVELRLNTAAGVAITDGGGAIFNNRGTVSIVGSEVRQNSVTGAGGRGGAVYSAAGSVAIISSTLDRNTAINAGGGVAVVTGTLLIVDGFLNDNRAGSPSFASGDGGGVYVASNATTDIFYSTFANNNARRLGGGIHNSSTGTLNLNHVTIRNNNSSGDLGTEGGGGVFNAGGTANVRFSILLENAATGIAGSGGGLFSTAGTVYIIGSTLTANSAVGAGGGIEVVNGTILFHISTLERNNAGSTFRANPGNGGGIHVSGGSAFVGFLASIAVGNTAFNAGGAFWIQAGSRLEVIAGLVFDNRASAVGGGAVYNNGGQVDLILANMSGNRALGDGGAIYNATGGTVNAEASTANANTASGRGGGIYNAGSVVYRNGLVQVNFASLGGGVFASAATSTVLDGSVVSGNTPDETVGV